MDTGTIYTYRIEVELQIILLNIFFDVNDDVTFCKTQHPLCVIVGSHSHNATNRHFESYEDVLHHSHSRWEKDKNFVQIERSFGANCNWRRSH
jgi:hypothetical protein